MIPFITFRETVGEDLCYFIVQKAHPHIQGVITYVPKASSISPSVPIAGYNLWVSFSGLLQGNFLPVQKGIEQELHKTLEAMAHWYLEHRIVPNEKKYKKFKLNTDALSTPAE